MFIRQKHNKSGSISIQIIDKSRGRYKVVKYLGSSLDPLKLDQLHQLAQLEMKRLLAQPDLAFGSAPERDLFSQMPKEPEAVSLIGPELILGSLFDDIGFDRVKDELFRHLVISSLLFPGSSLKTADYLREHKQLVMEPARIYSYLDKMRERLKEEVRDICRIHTQTLSATGAEIVYNFITPLRFETEDPVDLISAGLERDHKYANPHFLLNLAVTPDGTPISYDIVEGTLQDIHAFSSCLEICRTRHLWRKSMLIAEAGLRTDEIMEAIPGHHVRYCLGIRLKKEMESLQSQILALNLSDGESKEIVVGLCNRLMIDYSAARAAKEKNNRMKGVEKLRKAISLGSLTTKNLNNRGYNKYLKPKGRHGVMMDMHKIQEDARWDGLRGFLTNTRRMGMPVIVHELMHQVENAFKVSRTDLRVGPVYQSIRQRIDSHICIAFCAYKIFRELERHLKQSLPGVTPAMAIETAGSIYATKKESQLLIQNELQSNLLKLFHLEKK